MICSPFHLSVTLRTPVMSNGQLTLDAILSAARFRQTADLAKALQDLPLRATDGVWHGSSAWFEQPVTFIDIPYVQRLNGEQDWSLEHFSVARRIKGDIKIDTGGGPYVARLDRHKARAVRQVHFFGDGDGQQAADLISAFLPGLGAKTNHGFGMIESITVTPMSIDRALCDPLGYPMRPLPLSFWQGAAKQLSLQEIVVNEEGWRPPYWDHQNWTLCAIPLTRDVDVECLSEWVG